MEDASWLHICKRTAECPLDHDVAGRHVDAPGYVHELVCERCGGLKHRNAACTERRCVLENKSRCRTMTAAEAKELDALYEQDEAESAMGDASP